MPRPRMTEKSRKIRPLSAHPPALAARPAFMPRSEPKSAQRWAPIDTSGCISVQANAGSLGASYRLANFEAFELRVIQIQRLVVPCPAMRRAKRLRFGPGFEDPAVFPDGMRSIQRVIFSFGTSEKVELHATRHLVELADARQPDLLESRFRPFGYTETVHGDEH